VHTLQQAYP